MFLSPHIYGYLLQQEVTLKSLGVVVRYNGEKNMQVLVPKSLAGSVCGLCGSGNGFPEDDNTTGPNEDCSGEQTGVEVSFNSIHKYSLVWYTGLYSLYGIVLLSSLLNGMSL